MKLSEYDTIIFDLDFTIWDGCRPGFWAKLLQPPYTRSFDRIYGSNDEYVDLHHSFESIISELSRQGKNLGFASLGALPKVPYEEQPSIILLKMFKIYDYFQFNRILVYRDFSKTRHITPLGKTLYIDDAPEQLKEAKEFHSDIFTLDRKSFVNWRDIV